MSHTIIAKKAFDTYNIGVRHVYPANGGLTPAYLRVRYVAIRLHEYTPYHIF